jgi:hypothetical protein
MTKSHLFADKTRPSRDGHEFHEAWTARLSLRLVLQLDGLVGIAIEGLSPADQSKASKETVEIADLALYYGKSATFEAARVVVITQAKYSVSKARVAFRVVDAVKTIKKFAKTYRDYHKIYGASKVTAKLAFELVTNRPIYAEFVQAVQGLASGQKIHGEAAKQAKQFQKACGLKGKQLCEFAKKFSLMGSTGSLKESKAALSRTVADWSAARDSMARARLGDLRDMIRNKAGSQGKGHNVIRRTDVLAALHLHDPDELLPFPVRFPDVGTIVPREQLADVARIIPALKKPLIIHAEGGTGKTVFLQSLVTLLGANHACLIFDCFGGGVYRSPDDGRHRPGRGLLHIVNHLACLSLCDPLLPDNENTEALINAFRHRLTQCVATLQKASPKKQLLLFIDAADNAGMEAEIKRCDPFPRLLLESFQISGSIAGVKLIVSCRTHRRHYAKGNVDCEEIELRHFSKDETEKFLRARITPLTKDQVLVAHARSDGNPRVLEHLVRERGLLETSEINKPVVVDDLVRERINMALRAMLQQGYKQQEIDAFMAGLAKLPPPVPLDEYASSLGIEIGAVESFASDLAPLLERTKHGLIFRDEPTETFVKQTYVAMDSALQLLKNNLSKNQANSVYAANALPGLLVELDDGKSLFKLAFDETLPKSITSPVGKQKIRYTRIKAAVLHAARKENYNFLVRLLVELSTLAAVDQRGADYLADNPDFIVLSKDSEARRRLTEYRGDWAGRKHARLAIAMALSQDLEEALRHAFRANDWIDYYIQQDEKNRGDKRPERLDMASIPFCLIALNRPEDAGRSLGRWYDWFGFEVTEHLAKLLSAAKVLDSFSMENVLHFLDSLKFQVGGLAGAIAFVDLDEKSRSILVKKLAAACKKKQTVKIQTDYGQHSDYRLQDGLLKATAVALYCGQKKDAAAIAKVIPATRTGFWMFSDRFGTHDAFPFFAAAVLGAAARDEQLTFQHLLPQELSEVGGRVKTGLSLSDFQKAIKEEIEKTHKSEEKLPKEKKTFGYDKKSEAEKYVNERIEPLFEMAVALSETLSNDPQKRKQALLGFVGTWMKLRKKKELYTRPYEIDYLFNKLGGQVLEFCLWAGCVLKKEPITTLLQSLLPEKSMSDATLVKIVSILARHSDLHESAGETAIAAKVRIEQADDVSYRATMFASLAKAILPASVEDAKSYFQSGLDQMDAIGSGDYEFTNELLAFASNLKGKELEPLDFHTLTNLCELNLTGDDERFPWLDFGQGLARSSGGRGLAKLCRWHDRSKVSLECSLLPYLYSLLDQEKMDPAIALGLLRLSNPVEFRVCGTAHLAKLIEKKNYPNGKELIAELIRQFEANNPGSTMPNTVEVLGDVASRILGPDSEMTQRLLMTAPHFNKIRVEENERTNSHYKPNQETAKRIEVENKQSDELQKKLLANVNPCDEASLSKALDSVSATFKSFDAKKQLLAKAREKVDFSARTKYIEVVAKLNNVELFAKINELQQCKLAWQHSSVSLNSVFNKLGQTIVQLHADDFVIQGHFYGPSFKDVAELCGFKEHELILELIKTFAVAKWELPPSIWLVLASIISPQTKAGEGQTALVRLLRSGAAKLSTTVVDGGWKAELYPPQDEKQIAAGMTWLMLGSPSVIDRWRAAHSVRSFAQFDKWKIIDALVGKYNSTTAAQFQAAEIPFYFFHARLWLLISLARLSLDFPRRVGKYAATLQGIARDSKEPHLLLKYFAKQTLLNCQKSGGIKLPLKTVRALEKVNVSPFKTFKVNENRADTFYQGRPNSTPTLTNEFSLEYDFDKGEVNSVSRLFNFAHWNVNDLITAWVRRYDTNVKSMYDAAGRDRDERESRLGINSKRQSYGNQLGWHGLHVATGQLLAKCPIAIQRYDNENPWPEWYARQLLSRTDGLWLADGNDRAPLDTQVNLLEADLKSSLTSDKDKLLKLIRLGVSDFEDIAVEGHWQSPDQVRVMISSAFVVPTEARSVATKLAGEDGFGAFLPLADDYDGFGSSPTNKNRKTFPFIVSPSNEAGLDEYDPLGNILAICRPFFAKEIIKFGQLKPTDSFNRAWIDSNGRVVSRAEAWGSSERDNEGESKSGRRMTCSREFLKTLLSTKKLDLLVLVVLRKYMKSYGIEKSEYWHSTAVVHIDKSLKHHFYSGLANEPHESRW